MINLFEEFGELLANKNGNTTTEISSDTVIELKRVSVLSLFFNKVCLRNNILQYIKVDRLVLKKGIVNSDENIGYAFTGDLEIYCKNFKIFEGNVIKCKINDNFDIRILEPYILSEKKYTRSAIRGSAVEGDVKHLVYYSVDLSGSIEESLLIADFTNGVVSGKELIVKKIEGVSGKELVAEVYDSGKYLAYYLDGGMTELYEKCSTLGEVEEISTLVFEGKKTEKYKSDFKYYEYEGTKYEKWSHKRYEGTFTKKGNTVDFNGKVFDTESNKILFAGKLYDNKYKDFCHIFSDGKLDFIGYYKDGILTYKFIEGELSTIKEPHYLKRKELEKCKNIIIQLTNLSEGEDLVVKNAVYKNGIFSGEIYIDGLLEYKGDFILKWINNLEHFENFKFDWWFKYNGKGTAYFNYRNNRVKAEGEWKNHGLGKGEGLFGVENIIKNYPKVNFIDEHKDEAVYVGGVKDGHVEGEGYLRHGNIIYRGKFDEKWFVGEKHEVVSGKIGKTLFVGYVDIRRLKEVRGLMPIETTNHYDLIDNEKEIGKLEIKSEAPLTVSVLFDDKTEYEYSFEINNLLDLRIINYLGYENTYTKKHYDIEICKTSERHNTETLYGFNRGLW
jgi:hypothetical protein